MQDWSPFVHGGSFGTKSERSDKSSSADLLRSLQGAALRTFMPVMGAPPTVAPLRRHRGNSVSGYFLSLPCHLAEPRARLEAVRRQTRLKKRWQVARFNALVQRVALPLLPTALIPAVVEGCAQAAQAVGVSSVRGPDEGAEICGVPVRSFHYFGLFSPPRMPLMFGMGSVGGRLVVSLAVSCPEHNIDPDVLLAGLPEQIGLLQEAYA